jgi:hypothetical protein
MLDNEPEPRGLYFILEHPRRGTFRELDSDWRAGKRIDIPRFSSSGMRSDPDKASRFGSLHTILGVRQRIINADPKMEVLRVRRSSDFKALCPECGNWTDTVWDHKKGCSVYREEVARHGR